MEPSVYIILAFRCVRTSWFSSSDSYKDCWFGPLMYFQLWVSPFALRSCYETSPLQFHFRQWCSSSTPRLNSAFEIPRVKGAVEICSHQASPTSLILFKSCPFSRQGVISGFQGLEITTALKCSKFFMLNGHTHSCFIPCVVLVFPASFSCHRAIRSVQFSTGPAANSWRGEEKWCGGHAATGQSLAFEVGVSIAMGIYSIYGWFMSWKIPLKWMVWGYPHLWKPPTTAPYMNKNVR